jgi:hypothetical protein
VATEWCLRSKLNKISIDVLSRQYAIPSPLIDKTSSGAVYEAGTDASDGFSIPISPFFVVRRMVVASASQLPDASLDSTWLRCEVATDTGHHMEV